MIRISKSKLMSNQQGVFKSMNFYGKKSWQALLWEGEEGGRGRILFKQLDEESTKVAFSLLKGKYTEKEPKSRLRNRLMGTKWIYEHHGD